MDKHISIKRTVIASYLSSLLVILISIHIVIILVFLNWEDRRIKSEINKTSLAIHRELKTVKHLDKVSTIKLIHKKMAGFSITQRTQPSLHINLIYENIFFSSESIESTYDYKKDLGKFQFVLNNKNVLIIKNLLLKFGDKEIYVQIYSDSDEVKNDIIALINSLFFSSIFIIMISLGVVRKIDKIIHSPIHEITKTVKKINRHDLSKRITIINPNNELGKLSMVINEMIDRLDVSFKSQNRFISNASHELRTPLAVIKGYSDLLKAGAKSDPVMVDRGLTEILKEVNNMENLLKKLLFLARKENNILKNNIVPFEISVLIQELMEKQQLIDKDHTYKIIRNKTSILNADKDLILQALRELLKNSSKYTLENRQISIDSFHRRKYHYIVIKDQGKGIPKENLKHVFERFYIQDESRNRQKNSFGLGLSIVKDIIKLHDGNIYIVSELNVGTTVTIKLPRSI
ncbi:MULTISPECIES: sensor histidine kinase [Psychrilyobacter]|uniref:histidine kinase n=1 Tax=Psychrilyobacter piezotolerans TaxID=2293438 RepID=A0ABX9KGN8_9FUSO|nr:MULTISPECIES: HAMP domain-containing sensor histidine kinase [Psychrilyobacter]MCS5422423.1 HAMP domain-containing histidine kinase [Psychrilyobacter sp. S5]NDI78114.1 HAMP domain-containing histidine kinase [Psychrilyobacter piezotolerans]RDE61698.1 sensor histidine kinase [Psychrilyobacter sp. S5]REI41090.1 HAMP domain-containing protein [Psychrilyobacter piezotolerans]